MDLSVLIPARNERWLKQTVEDVLAHAECDTEVIVVLDGAWPVEPLVQHPRVTVVKTPQAIGQRAATNLSARISNARYVMKLDAHCAVAQGFDRALIEAAQTLGPDVTQIPAQFNLHVFDWQCDICGHRTYQGPTPTTCDKGCASPTFTRAIVWQPRKRRRTEAWRFDSDLHFQYWNEYRQEGDLIDTMSCLGACWFLERVRYWQIDGLDEGHGSWGQMGTELACKSWLSGGRMVTNRLTWFAHLFRTQGGDFGFPYPITGAEQDRARQYSRTLWAGGHWPKAKYPLRWLVEKFNPPGWTPEQVSALPSRRPSPATKGIVYYSDNRPDRAILDASRRSIAASGLPIAAVTIGQGCADWDEAAVHLHLPWERGYLTMFRQILAGLEALDTEIAFLCEHDVLYHPSHFEFTPPSDAAYFYNLHVWKVDAASGRAVTYQTKQTSGLCANRQLLVRHYRERIRRVEAEGFSRRMGFEPGSHSRKERVDDVPSDVWRSACPNLDIRHDRNLTESRWSPSQFRDPRNCQGWQEADTVPGWGRTAGRMGELLTAGRAEEAA